MEDTVNDNNLGLNNTSPGKRKRPRRRDRKKATAGTLKLRSLIDGATKSTENVAKSPIDVENVVSPVVDGSPTDEQPVLDDSDKLGSSPRIKRMNQKDKSKTYKDQPNVLFIGNVPLAMGKSELIRRMKIDPKIVKSMHFRSLPVDSKFATNKRVGIIRGLLTDAKSNKNAYLTLVDEKYVEDVLKKNTMEIDGHYLFINRSSPASFSKFNRKKTVFVGRLPPSTNENELFDLFSNVGLVKETRVVRDPKTHESKGFGFVSFDSRNAVPEAIAEFNNKEFKGYTLHVMKALDQDTALQHKAKNAKNGTSSKKRTKKPLLKGDGPLKKRRLHK
ncbi:hypothetical protein BgAZ_110410 [Babesia gibsoni]|uniref:RRM domain-containing protein n=1 Tax=Babesia gibsoni TaxID=33632 RepID=A0AAD8USU2_BABGI|nr:hypothetical protein BgAZ_110410 [Babesia gibsoni]